jgi:3-oxoacyl-[acyl-carrier protein] reductase
MINHEQRFYIVTGASRGLGFEIALKLLSQNATVGINYRQDIGTMQSLIDMYPKTAIPLRFDVRNWDEIEQEFARFVKCFGTIDGLVNNAGILRSSLLTCAKIDDIKEVVDTNLLGVIYCSKCVLRTMIKRQSGVIVNIGSSEAQKPSPGNSIYSATKCAIEALTRSIALEIGSRNIRAVCVAPGPLQTDMLHSVGQNNLDNLLRRIPLGRIADPSELAGYVSYLLSDNAKYVSGCVHSFDGGLR